MFSHIALILSEKTASLAVSSSSMVDFNDEDEDTKYLTDGETPVTDMGGQGTGDPWWIWIIVGVLIFALCACLGFGMYRKKTGYYDKKKGELPTIQEDVATDDGLDEPFLSAVDTPSIL